MAKSKRKVDPADDGVATALVPPAKKRWSGRMLNSGKKGSSITQANASQSPLLRLPPEIRNRIWELALVEETLHVAVDHSKKPTNARHRQHLDVYRCHAAIRDHEAAINMRHGEKRRADDTAVETYQKRQSGCLPGFDGSCTTLRPYPVALLATCRQVHSEAALIPLETNTFSVGHAYELQQFAKRLMVIQQKIIRAVTVAALTGRKHTNNVKKLIGLNQITIFEETGWAIRLTAPEFIAYRLPPFVTSNLTKVTMCLANNGKSQEEITSMSQGGWRQRCWDIRRQMKTPKLSKFRKGGSAELLR